MKAIHYKHSHFRWTPLIIFSLLIIGGFFRFYNLNWDEGHFFHPDERNIANAVAKIEFFNKLNPEFFAYGGFSIYLYRAAGEFMNDITNNLSWSSDWGYINILGRFFSALFSTLTIIPLYFLAKKISNRSVALIAITLYSFTVSSIQIAHYAVTESLFTLTGVLLCLLGILLFEKQKLWIYILCGITLGLAGATKITELAFGLFLGISHIGVTVHNRKRWLKLQFFFLFLLVVALCFFTLFSPYTFITADKFMESMRYEGGVADGSLSVPYTKQFIGTLPYLFQLQNFFWQMGIIAVLILPAIGWLFVKMVKEGNWKLCIFLSVPIIYFFYIGSLHTKFIRYMLPILPFLLIIISYFLWFIYKKTKTFGIILLTIAFSSSILWTLAFFSIYIIPQTRLQASQWIYQHIPKQSRIYTEHWDDGLPVDLPAFSPGQYQIDQLTIYEPDTEQKLDYYAEKLASGDYIIINSRRLYGTLIRLTKEYPLTSKYYTMLFNEALGYRKIAEFSSYPKLFGRVINDDASEETFQVYDHPRIFIFKNIQRYSKEQLKDLLQ